MVEPSQHATRGIILERKPASSLPTFPDFEHMKCGEIALALRKHNPDASCWMGLPDRTGFYPLDRIGLYKATGSAMTVRELLSNFEIHPDIFFMLDHVNESWPVSHFVFFDNDKWREYCDCPGYENASGHLVFFPPICQTVAVLSGKRIVHRTIKKVSRNDYVIGDQELTGWAKKQEDGSWIVHGDGGDMATLIETVTVEEAKERELAAASRGGSLRRTIGHGVGSVCLNGVHSAG